MHYHEIFGYHVKDTTSQKMLGIYVQNRQPSPEFRCITLLMLIGREEYDNEMSCAVLIWNLLYNFAETQNEQDCEIRMFTVFYQNDMHLRGMVKNLPLLQRAGNNGHPWVHAVLCDNTYSNIYMIIHASTL